ncbi:hypothetical protein SUGI_1148030 [Cryptomeria japonica]|nr:hypothetical protein SUGI_1148030 [Cryptomeria japonica]
MPRFFHIEVRIKDKKVLSFYTYSQANLTSHYLVNELRLQVVDHPQPYVLSWLKVGVEIEMKKQSKVKKILGVDYKDKLLVNAVLLDVCGMVLDCPCQYCQIATN